MSQMLWFVLGLLCGGGAGVAVFLCLPKEKRLPPCKGVLPPKRDRKVWGQTRNFLYYDGTMMPEIKEDLNE